MRDKLIRRFKDEAVAVYAIEKESSQPDFKRYVVSTRDTRDLMNHPEIINCDFTNLMRNGITNALKGINVLDRLSCINSKSVNVCHILRGGLNFQVRDALRKAYGYKWHSSSYISSQRILKKGRFEITEDQYRKFIIPNDATLYTADIVASGVSLNHGFEYIDSYLESQGFELENMIFITIGCIEAERVLQKWHDIFKEKYPEKQLATAGAENLSLWDEYNSRFPLDMYFVDIGKQKKGSPGLLQEKKSSYWQGLRVSEYSRLYEKFEWLWSDQRVEAARIPGSFAQVCEKKIKYLRSLIESEA